MGRVEPAGKVLSHISRRAVASDIHETLLDNDDGFDEQLRPKFASFFLQWVQRETPKLLESSGPLETLQITDIGPLVLCVQVFTRCLTVDFVGHRRDLGLPTKPIASHSQLCFNEMLALLFVGVWLGHVTMPIDTSVLQTMCQYIGLSERASLKLLADYGANVTSTDDDNRTHLSIISSTDSALLSKASDPWRRYDTTGSYNSVSRSHSLGIVLKHALSLHVVLMVRVLSYRALSRYSFMRVTAIVDYGICFSYVCEGRQWILHTSLLPTTSSLGSSITDFLLQLWSGGGSGDTRPSKIIRAPSPEDKLIWHRCYDALPLREPQCKVLELQGQLDLMISHSKSMSSSARSLLAFTLWLAATKHDSGPLDAVLDTL